MENKTNKSKSITNFIIAMLGSSRNPRAFRMIMKEREFSQYKKESIQVALSRLNKKGYVNNSNNEWSLTKEGKIFLNKTSPFNYIVSNFNKNSPINTIVSFDIPETNRVSRNWVRNQLKIFNYKMLQQSLWLGPGPLPTNFIKRLNELKIRENIKIFPIKKKI